MTWLGKYFLNKISKALIIKENTEYLDYIKIKTSFSMTP